MKVLQITRDFPPHSTGGISSAVGGLVEALIATGIEVLVLSFDGWRPVSKRNEDKEGSYETYGEVRVWRVSSPAQVATALRKVIAAGPDVLHVHHGMLWQTCDAFDEGDAFAALPKIFTAHVLQQELNRQRDVTQTTMSLAGQEVAFAAADVVIAPSEAAEGILMKDYPNLAGRLCRIGFGVRAACAMKERSYSPSALYSGRFSDVKGTAELVAVVPRILDAVNDAEIVIAGGNPESPASDRRWRRRFAESLREDQRKRVHLQGWLTENELAEHYSSAWVQLCPSWFETFGLAALEAMAYGACVVGTTGGALPELIVDGESGLLSPARDIEAFAANTILVLNDRELARRLGRVARERANRLFSWSEVGKKHFEVYESCLR